MVEFYIPQSTLSEYIRVMVYSELYQEHTIERLVPDGSVNIVFELSDIPQYIFHTDGTPKIKYEGVWISGMHTNFIDISASSKGLLILQFHPAGVYPILNIPVKEINNKVVGAEMILGNSIFEIREQIIAASSVKSKFQIIEQWLLERISERTGKEDLIRHSITQLIGNQNNIAEIIGQTGYSHRYFIEMFTNYVGLSPKQYQRIVRFNKVLQLIKDNKMINWTQLSLDCGYFDQAHFIKDFKNFSGINPNEYLISKSEYEHYIPIA